MPLSEPASRELLHTRSITYKGYKRNDDLWDIEGHLVDAKTYPLRNTWRDLIEVGEPFHEMLIRVTFDNSYVIKDIEAVTENSPFEICPEIAPNYKSLVGITMGAGWRRLIRQKVGGTAGCTHITELLFPVATVAIQTLMGQGSVSINSTPKVSAETKANVNESGKPFALNTCHAWASDSSMVKARHPLFYTGLDSSKEAETKE